MWSEASCRYSRSRRKIEIHGDSLGLDKEMKDKAYRFLLMAAPELGYPNNICGEEPPDSVVAACVFLGGQRLLITKEQAAEKFGLVACSLNRPVTMVRKAVNSADTGRIC